MAERKSDNHLERLLERRKIFTLKATVRRVGERYPKEESIFPHFPVPLNINEERILDNFSLTISNKCPQTRTIELTVKQICEGNFGTTINQVQKKGQVLLIGNIAEIVLRKFRQDGRPVLHMAVLRGIRVGSPERNRQQVQDRVSVLVQSP